MKTQTVSCGCVVVRYRGDEPEVLLVRPFADRDSWGIPKGHVNVGEDHVTCALRETLEESGIVAAIVDEALPSVSTSYRNERKTVFAFLARPVNELDTPVASDGENVAIGYFPFSSLPNIHVYQRALLANAKKRIEELGREVFDLDYDSWIDAPLTDEERALLTRPMDENAEEWK